MTDIKLFEWIFEKGLSFGLSVYFVWYFTAELKPKINALIDSINALVQKDTIQESTLSRIENKVNKTHDMLDAIAKSVYKN